MAKCDYLLPRHNTSLTPEQELAECALPQGHPNEHLSQLADGRWILWLSCMCEEDEEEEDCECFDYVILKPDDVQERIARS